MAKTLDEVLAHYAIALPNPGMANSFNPISGDALQLIYDRVGTYKPLIDARPQAAAALLELYRFVRGNPPGPGDQRI
jgi:hypothetical protein